MGGQIAWQIINPEGVVNPDSLTLNIHRESLEGKTVLLYWNGKHNGDVFLNRVAELLTGNVNDVKIIRSWEVAPETAMSSSSPDTSREFARKLADFKPGIAISSQGD